MTQDNLLLYLIAATFGLALAYGVYQWLKVTKARREHHHSVKQRQDAAARAVPVAVLPEPAVESRTLR
jgi:hypothetical protein